MVEKIIAPRGTSDILPEEITLWRQIEVAARRILENYGYAEIRTPIFEETGLFVRSLGQTSDVVQKQILQLATEKQNGLALRPEGTAGVVRAYIEHDMDKKQNLAKLYYIGPMFRGERPQKGRLRQFHHIGVEAIGMAQPFLDVEVIALSVNLLKGFGLAGFKLKINSLGSPEDKKNLSIFLRDQLQVNISHLCEDCRQRFERNVFRILDCKNEACRKIVSKLDLSGVHLCEESKVYFSKVKEGLNLLNISFEVSPFLVRGLDYYTHTVFEISHESLGSQDALGAGGRYDRLVQELGGPSVGAMGFALGLERIILAGPTIEGDESLRLQIFLVTMGEEAYKKGFLLANDLRTSGLSAEMNYETASIKSQMRLADKMHARLVIIIGEDEIKEEAVTLKDMSTGSQEKIAVKNLIEVIKKKLC